MASYGRTNALPESSSECSLGFHGRAHHQENLCGTREEASNEQIVNLLRQVRIGVANGKSMAKACKEAGDRGTNVLALRKGYGGLKMDQTRWLKELEQENAKLKWLVFLFEPGEAGVEGHSLGNILSP
jgi:putative transposase